MKWQRTGLMVFALAAGAMIGNFAVGIAFAGPRPGDLPTLAQTVNGEVLYLFTIDATTTAKTNAEATTAYTTDLSGKVLLIQNAGAVDARVYPVTSATGDVSNSRGAGFGPAIAPGERVILTMSRNSTHLAGIMTSTTGNIDVWELK